MVDARGLLEPIFPLIAGGLRRKWWPSAFCVSMLVAPVIARTKGRRRAGQGRDSIGEFGAAKRTLDAPEPSRRINRRSDGHEHRVVLQILSRPRQPELPTHFRSRERSIDAQTGLQLRR